MIRLADLQTFGRLITFEQMMDYFGAETTDTQTAPNGVITFEKI